MSNSQNNSFVFPSGRSVRRVKQDAKALSKEQNIPLSKALDLLAIENGVDSPWDQALTLTTPYVPPECCECGSRENLLVIRAGDCDLDDTEDRICVSCAKTSSDFGLCFYCELDGEGVAYPLEYLNQAGECGNHKGESAMTPEEQEGWEHNIQRWSEG